MWVDGKPLWSTCITHWVLQRQIIKCALSVIRILLLGRMRVHSCRREATDAEESWAAWLSKDGDESGQLCSRGARCSIRLHLNIALESRSRLSMPPRLRGTPARPSFLILVSTVRLCSLGWPSNSPVVGARSRSCSCVLLFSGATKLTRSSRGADMWERQKELLFHAASTGADHTTVF